MYIVTGAAGMIGSAIVWSLNRKGITDIIAVDNLGDSDKWKNLRALKFCDYLEKDTFRKLFPLNAFPGVDAIIHMGACSSTTEKDASYLIDNNFACSKELALYAAEKKIKFIYASSAATYGDGEAGYLDDENSLDLLRPMNMYGYSKHMFDLWARKNGLLKQITGVKFFNIYGPNEHHKGDMRSVVHRSYGQVKETGLIKLFKSYKKEYADGEQKRDFLYVKDAADIVLHLLDKNASGIYNVGSGKAQSWNLLAQAVFDAFGLPHKIEYIDMPLHLRDRYQYFTQANTDKLRSTGYDRPPMSLKDAVKHYIQGYLMTDSYLGDEKR